MSEWHGGRQAVGKGFFKKRVMNSVQCYDNVKDDEGGNGSRIHDGELLRSTAGRATEECLGKE